jgi:hypothetical protein
MNIQVSTLENEGAMQASKWLHAQALLDAKELEALFEALGDFSIFIAGAITKKEEGELSKDQFLASYTEYINRLQKGETLDIAHFRSLLTVVLTKSTEALYAIEMEGGRELIRLRRPVIQIQMHNLAYSDEEKKFRPMIFGENSTLWGLQFAYPQIVSNGKTQTVEKVEESTAFPNTALFKTLQRWMRNNTRATPFLVGEEKTRINVSMRLGKECFSWINTHPQLIKQSIEVLI